jgi:uncharacterized protein (TIGR02118 family)
MMLVSVMYPSGAGTKFDTDYYVQKHIPLVKARWKDMGLQDARIVHGIGTPSGAPPTYQVMALLTFKSLQDFQKAAAKHGEEIFADIPKFTNVQPVVQFNEALG